MNKRGIRGIYFGWWTVIFSGVLTGMGMGFTGGGMSVLFKPISSELGMTRAATSLAAGISRLQSGIEAPLTGWMSDKFGPRWVIIGGLGLIITGLVLMKYIVAPWHYYLVWGVLIGMGSNLALTIAFDKALTNWFIAKSGLAFGVRFGVIGIISASVVPLIAFLVDGEGWRNACLIWAIVLSTGLPLTWFLVKQNPPEHYGLLPDGVDPKTDTGFTNSSTQNPDSVEETIEIEFTLKQAMKTMSFWFIVLAFSCATLVMGSLNLHIIPFLTDIGIDPLVAGGMMAMMVFFTVPARFLGGAFADRIRKDRLQFIIAAAFLVQALGIIAFLVKQNITMAYVMMILYGIGSGAPTPVRLSMGGKYFGRKAFASILGVTMFLTAPLSLVAPIYAGWIYDTMGSYNIAFTTFAILLLCATLFASFIRPPKLPE
ncbi:MFS transporter [Chloroflexota bacterium]